MPSINLIAEQRAQKRAAEKKARNWFFALVSVSTAGFLAFGFLFLRVESLKANARGLESQIEKLRPVRDEIDANKTTLAELQPKLTILADAQKTTQRWWRIFDHIGKAIPPQTWISNLKSSQPNDMTKPVEITWTGMSADQTLIGNLMDGLSACPELGMVSLRYTEQKHAVQGVGIEFSIVSIVPGTDDPKAVAAKTKKEESKKS